MEETPEAAIQGSGYGMTDDRYARLMADDSEPLQQGEVDAGWHFCPEWDGLLVGPGMWEFEHCCPCGRGGHCDV